jgi:hypothetical protein
MSQETKSKTRRPIDGRKRPASSMASSPVRMKETHPSDFSQLANLWFLRLSAKSQFGSFIRATPPWI